MDNYMPAIGEEAGVNGTATGPWAVVVEGIHKLVRQNMQVISENHKYISRDKALVRPRLLNDANLLLNKVLQQVWRIQLAAPAHCSACS